MISARGKQAHSSHKLGKSHSEIRCPGSEPRFYGVRECKHCGAEEMRHPAGEFMDELLSRPCTFAVMKTRKKKNRAKHNQRVRAVSKKLQKQSEQAQKKAQRESRPHS